MCKKYWNWTISSEAFINKTFFNRKLKGGLYNRKKYYLK